MVMYQQQPARFSAPKDQRAKPGQIKACGKPGLTQSWLCATTPSAPNADSAAQQQN